MNHKMHPATRQALESDRWRKSFSWQCFGVSGDRHALSGCASEDEAQAWIQRKGAGWRSVDVRTGFPEGWLYLDGGRSEGWAKGAEESDGREEGGHRHRVAVVSQGVSKALRLK